MLIIVWTTRWRKAAPPLVMAPAGIYCWYHGNGSSNVAPLLMNELKMRCMKSDASNSPLRRERPFFGPEMPANYCEILPHWSMAEKLSNECISIRLGFCKEQ